MTVAVPKTLDELAAEGSMDPGWAEALPEASGEPLRGLGHPALARVERGRCLDDPRCVPESLDAALADAVREVLRRLA